MSKRFTCTEKWQDPWFRNLDADMQRFWFFILDHCDMAGIWKIDLELAGFFLRAQLDSAAILGAFDKRIVPLKCGKKWWVPKFIEFQYGTLREECRPHNAVIQTLKKETLWKPYTKGIYTLQDKDKDKDKDKDLESTLPPALHNDQFKAAWKDWKQHRKEIRKPLTPTTAKKQIAWCEKVGPVRAAAALNRSIAGGWTGIHEEDSSGNTTQPRSRHPGMRTVQDIMARENA